MAPESLQGEQWLQAHPAIVDAVMKFRDHLKHDVEREVAYPSRPELRRRLGKIRDAAKLLLDELSDTRINAMLYGGEPVWTTPEHGLGHGCHDLLGRVARASEKIPKRQGRAKHFADPALGPDPREHCALIVSIVWQAGTGDWPGERNKRAWSVCETLWLAADGERHGGLAAQDESLAAWRRHLRAARAFREPHPAGKLVEHLRKTAAGDAAEGAALEGAEKLAK